MDLIQIDSEKLIFLSPRHSYYVSMQTSGYVVRILVRTTHPFFVVRFGKESFHDHSNVLNWPIYSDVTTLQKKNQAFAMTWTNCTLDLVARPCSFVQEIKEVVVKKSPGFVQSTRLFLFVVYTKDKRYAKCMKQFISEYALEL